TSGWGTVSRPCPAADRRSPARARGETCPSNVKGSFFGDAVPLSRQRERPPSRPDDSGPAADSCCLLVGLVVVACGADPGLAAAGNSSLSPQTCRAGRAAVGLAFWEIGRARPSGPLATSVGAPHGRQGLATKGGRAGRRAPGDHGPFTSLLCQRSPD